MSVPLVSARIAFLNNGCKDSKWRLTSSTTEGVLNSLVIEDQHHVKLYHGVFQRACTLQMILDFDTPVLDSFWCYFDEKPSDNENTNDCKPQKSKCLCVREKGLLTFLMASGHVHHLPLPFLVKGVWPLSKGILFERCVTNGDDGLSVLFSLSHPMDDICPLTYRRTYPINGSCVGYFTDSTEHVVGTSVSESMTLIVLFRDTDSALSVYQVKPAQVEDVPSPLPSTPDRRNASSVLGTPHPHSSSAPARFIHVSPGSALKFSLNVEPSPTTVKIGSCDRKSVYYSPDMLKPKAFQRIKKDVKSTGSGRRSSPRLTPSTAANTSNTSIKSSGRSPFIDRYKTPTNNSARSTWGRKEKSSIMPPTRISPFSQVMEPQCFAMYYSDETLKGDDDYTLLLPQLCLHSIWLDRSTSISCSISKVFVAVDWNKIQFIVLLAPSISKLFYLSLTRDEGGVADEGCVTVSQSVFASVDGVKDALYLESIGMILVLTISDSLELYNGASKVCNVDVGNGLGIGLGTGMCPGSISAISNSIGNEFSLVTSNDEAYLCSIDDPITHPIVKLSIKALVYAVSYSPDANSSDCINDVLLKTYLLLIGCSNTNGQQWIVFTQWLLSCFSIPSKCLDFLISLNKPVDPVLADTPLSNLFTTSHDGGQIITDQETAPDPNMVVTSLCHYSFNILASLHLLYEELKLNVHYHHYLYDLAVLLYIIASHHQWYKYTDHYIRDHPLLLDHVMTTGGERTDSYSSMNEDESFLYIRNTPPGIYQWMYGVLDNSKVEPYPVLSSVCKMTSKIVKIYSRIAGHNPADDISLYELIDHTPSISTPSSKMELSAPPSAIQSSQLSEDIVTLMITEGLSVTDVSSLPAGVSVPLQCLLLQCRRNPSSKWAPEVYDVIGRSDVGRTLYDGGWGSSEFLKLDIVQPDGDNYEMDVYEEIYKLKFPKDTRLREVKRLLQSTKPVRVPLVQTPEMSDHEFVDLQKTQLLNICQRTMSLSIGRGMFTMATVRPILFSPMKIPKLNLSGRAPPRNNPVTLEASDYPSDMVVWPEFHNGVSVALKLGSDIDNIDSTWIVFNQPSDENCINTYAGFLMGLGLNGHLNSLNSFHLFEYLQQKHEVTVIALLLGISAAKCGSMNLSIASSLSLFLPALLPQGSIDLETTVLMQTAAMMGLGLLYMSSCNRFLAETVLKQIGHSPGPELEFSRNRECYSLIAGLALGMIALGNGSSTSSLSDLHIEDQLCMYIDGGSKNSEGDIINTHVTAPGGIVALGLIYLKTNDSNIAERLTPPKTLYQLECIRPDFLMLKVLSHGLIMWDQVSPTQEWVYSLIPEIVNKYAFEEAASNPADEQSNDVDYQTMCQSKAYIIAGACLALGFRYAGTYNDDAYQCLLNIHNEVIKHQNLDYIGKNCMESFICAILLALSMVKSGSGDLETLRLVRMHRVKTSELSYGKHMAVHMALGLLFLGGGRYTLSRSNKAIASLLCSIYPHFPMVTTDNRYHLQALRHFYVLATEPRVLVTRESDTKEPCSVPIQFILNDNDTVSSVTPCVMPENTIKISIGSGTRYWAMEYDLRDKAINNAVRKNGYIFVKRHTACVPYTTDPQGLMTRLSLSMMSSKQQQFGSVCKFDSSIEQLFNGNKLRNMYSYLCHSKELLYTTILINCIGNDQMELVDSFMELNECMLDSNWSDDSVLRLWSVRLCHAFLNSIKFSMQPELGQETSTLDQFVEYTLSRINTKMETTMPNNIDLKELSMIYLNKHQLPAQPATVSHTMWINLAMYLQTIAAVTVQDQHALDTAAISQVDRLLREMYTNGVSPSTAAKTILAYYQPPPPPGIINPFIAGVQR